MCGRFTHFYTWEQLCRFMGLLNTPAIPGFATRYNVAPSQDAPIVRTTEGTTEVAMTRWGLAPHWTADPMRGPINARIETIDTNRLFRDALAKRRCLVPVSGFYEWQDIGDRAPKQPWFIAPRDDDILAFAGLWERHEAFETFAIITMDADDSMRAIHDRMPVMLPRDAFDAWLAPTPSPEDAKAVLLASEHPPLKRHAVATRVNSPKIDDPALLDEVEPDRSLFS